MSFNNKVLLVASFALVFQLISSLSSNSHLFVHISYSCIGLAIGMLIGRHLTEPKLIKKTSHVINCSKKSSSSSEAAECTVTVMKQYCYVINTPLPQQICFWVREEHRGEWNAERGCCEVVLDGRLTCAKTAQKC